MASTRVVYRPNKAGLDHVLRDRNGPVALYTANLGRQVEGAARRRVNVKTGKLKASIKSRLVRSSLGGYNVEVSADTPYSTYVHSGFPAFDLNRSVLIQGVGWRFIRRHPGYRGSFFLLRAMQDVGLNARRR